MSEQSAPTAAARDVVSAFDGPLGFAGHRILHQWSPPAMAPARAAELVAAHCDALREVVCDPHITEEWAQAIVRTRAWLPPFRM
jgi:hypothetical protein